MKIISHKKASQDTLAKTKKKSSYDPKNLQITLTCQSGLESLVRREGVKLGLTDTGGQDRIVNGKGDLETLYRLLVGSRFANRVYIDLTPHPSPKSEGDALRIETFDELHDTLTSIDWGSYLTGKELIIIEASSTRSVLSSTPTIQSVAQKAIYSTMNTPNNANAIEVHILILLIDDVAHILLDVTGEPLHKRGYRTESGEAPIKENLSAALIAFSGWRYQEALHDPFCGSGTIAIEAAMMARNIAPGLDRMFRIQSLPFHDRVCLEEVKTAMRAKIYPSGKYQIIASDIDPAMIEMARRNALRAGVSADIHFEEKDFVQHSKNPTLQKSAIVTNPPYGKRLESDDLHEIYTRLCQHVQSSGGGFITTYPIDVRFGLANKKLLNGAEECRFWYKKNPPSDQRG